MQLTLGQKIFKYTLAAAVGLSFGVAFGFVNLLCAAFLLGSIFGPAGTIAAMACGAATFLWAARECFKAVIYYHEKWVERNPPAVKPFFVSLIEDFPIALLSTSRRQVTLSPSMPLLTSNAVALPGGSTSTASISQSLGSFAPAQSAQNIPSHREREQISAQNHVPSWREYATLLCCSVFDRRALMPVVLQPIELRDLQEEGGLRPLT